MSGAVEIEIDQDRHLIFGWIFEEFNADDPDWKKVHHHLDEMGKKVKVAFTDREVNYDAMPELLRKVMGELSVHELPTPQHASGPDDKGIWEIDYLVDGKFITIWYWPEEILG